jgi:hypothetical protein
VYFPGRCNGHAFLSAPFPSSEQIWFSQRPGAVQGARSAAERTLDGEDRCAKIDRPGKGGARERTKSWGEDDSRVRAHNEKAASGWNDPARNEGPGAMT